MYCIKCGTKLPDDAAFCFRCGVSQQVSDSHVANPSGRTEYKQISLTWQPVKVPPFGNDKHYAELLWIIETQIQPHLVDGWMPDGSRILDAIDYDYETKKTWMGDIKHTIYSGCKVRLRRTV